MPSSPNPPPCTLAITPAWPDYELLDTGAGRKLERYGPYRIVRPEPQALWQPALPDRDWASADATFQAEGTEGNEEGGRWRVPKPLPESWPLTYRTLRFHAQLTPFRHLGLFPEQATHWDWMTDRIAQARTDGPVKVLNLFAYTGVATLAAAAAGAEVVHLDASKKSIGMARENQRLSGLEDRPIRWIEDDALAFLRREERRGSCYHGIILDPPKFGRGTKGQVWKLMEDLPALLQLCRAVLADRPLFVLLTAYAIRASYLGLHYAVEEALKDLPGALGSGETCLQETGAGRILSTALFSRWSRA
jgi:23S rRNA (cytosine1962-C5)-methyltransferase